MHKNVVVRFSLSLLCLIVVLRLSAQQAPTKAGGNGVEVIQPVKQDVSGPLSQVLPVVEDPSKPKKEKPLGHPNAHTPGSSPDGALQQSIGPLIGTSSGQNLLGVGFGFVGPAGAYGVGVAPSDSNGAVGTTQYVQWVNTAFAIFDKASGAVLYGAAAGNTLWSGFGGPCETNNDGDPIVQYDKAANRWIFSQFSVSTTPYYQCVAVSTTSDATGSYYRYAFSMPNFPDYPKMGVWPDAYYISFNMFSGNTFVGPRVCAMDRQKMLTGAAATQQCFQLGTTIDSLLPSDLDGATAPPAGSPDYFLNLNGNAVELRKFHVDWSNPANTTLTGPNTLAVAPYTEACNGGVCIPQSGTSQKLDSLGDRLMYRLAYRNFGDHESLVVNHSVAADSSTGVRWYEIRNPGGTPAIYQQGTFAPDSSYRWMGSMAMDKSGDIAVGYSVSSSSMHPAIRYTGRVPTDALGTLETEKSIIEGTGSQTPSLNRWGDYTGMSIDPVDDCTFWYTNQYIQSNGNFNWSTRIASFKFPSCGSSGDTTPPTVSMTAPTNGSTVKGTVTVSANATDNVGVTSVQFKLDGSNLGNPVTGAGPVYSIQWDTTTTTNTTHTLAAVASDAAGNNATSSISVTVGNPPVISAVSAGSISSSGATITWTTNTPSDSQVAYGTTSSYGSTSALDSTLVTSHSVALTGLAASTTYHYQALSRDAQGNLAASSDFTFTTAASNTPPTQGLIGYWNFDENSGSIAHDSSGSGYNGTINNAAWTTGKINSALSFNGSTSDVVTPGISLGNTFSVSAWVNPSSVPQGGYVRIAETQYNGGLYLGTNSAGNKYKFIVNTGTGSTGSCGMAFGCAEGGSVSSGWHLITASFDGATATLYVDNAVAATDTFTAPGNTTFPLYIGRYYGSTGFGWNGAIDEVRLYNRALTASEVSLIFNYTGGPPDTTPPSTPTNVSATGISSSQVNVSWSASTDNVGVAGYKVFRNGVQVGTTASLSYPDSGLSPSTTYSYTVAAFDAAGNVSAQSLPANGTTLAADTIPPTVSITAPAANSTVSGTVTVSANASDNVAVHDVQFQLDGNNLGPDLTTAPYSISWDTTTAANTVHTLTAIAKDTSGNSANSAPVTVTVSNTITGPPTQGLIGYWNFDEGSGAVAHDTSGSGYTGAVNGATWTTGKINSALSFNGSSNDVLTPAIALGNTFSISAWVNPAAAPQGGYARIAETQYNNGLYLGTNSSGGKYKFIVKAGAGSTGSCGAGFGCAEGGTVTSGWHLITATFDGTSATLYVDNAAVATDTFTAPGNTSLPLYIGLYYGGSGFGWNGGIDEVRLYNRALTSTEVSAIFSYAGGPPDTTPPTVSITAPAANSTVSNTITVSANASDNVAVADVQFQLDGANLGPDLTSAPYSISWNTTTATNTTHTLTAIAKDTSGNTTASAPITVTVSNTVVGPPTQGLVGYWNFDEGSGSVAHDSSGNGYNGTVNGAAWTAGKINSALNFNGSTTDVVTFNISLPGTFSVSAWVNPAILSQTGYARILETQYNGGLYLGLDSSGTRYKFIVNTGAGATGSCGAAFGCAEGGALTSGWHLITATFDGTTALLYVDSTVVATDTFTAPGNTAFPLYVGRYYGSTGFGWNGSIDEVRLYNRALSSAEVSSIVNYTGP